MNKLLLIVDGPTEIGALKAKFYHLYNECPEIRLGPGNGISYKIEGYAKGVLPNLQFNLKLNSQAIILMPDFEKRTGSISDFEAEIKNQVIEKLVETGEFSTEDLLDRIFVCCPNIMFENWIIADVEGIKSCTDLINDNFEQELFDGHNGSSILKKNMKLAYKKTTHGKKLFKRVRDKTASENSESYMAFATKISELKIKYCS